MGPVAPGARRGREDRVRRPAVGVSTGRCANPFADRSTAVARLPRVSGSWRAHAGGRVGPDPTRVGRAAWLLQLQTVECRRDEGGRRSNALRDLCLTHTAALALVLQR